AGLDRLLTCRETLDRVALAVGELGLGALEACLAVLQLAFELLLLCRQAAGFALESLVRLCVLERGRFCLPLRRLELLPLPVGVAVALLCGPLGLLQLGAHRVELASGRLRGLRALLKVALLLDQPAVALVERVARCGDLAGLLDQLCLALGDIVLM